MSTLNFFSLLLISTALVTRLFCEEGEIDYDESEEYIMGRLDCWLSNGDLTCKNEFNITANVTENFTKQVELDVEKNSMIAKKHRDCKVLEMSRENVIERLPQKLGLLFQSLEILRASQIGLKSIVKDDFADMKMLRTLILSYNQLATLLFDAFNNLKDLEKLNLEGNKIRSLHVAIFSEITSLKIISLAENRLQRLDDVFQRNFLLEEIYLEGNQLKSINVEFSNRTLLKLVNLKNNSEICVCKKLITNKSVDYSSCDVNNANRRNMTNFAYQNCVIMDMKLDNKTGKFIEHCTGNLTQLKAEIEKNFTKCASSNDKSVSFDYCLFNRLRIEQYIFDKFDDCIYEEISNNIDVEGLLRTCTDEKAVANKNIEEIYSKCLFCKPDNSTSSSYSRIEKCDIEYNNSGVQSLSTFQDMIIKYFRD